MRSVYLRLSVTDACDLRCAYCRPAGTPRRAGPRLDAAQQLALVERLDGVVALEKVRITGGEPTLLPRLPALVRDLRALLPRATVAMTTNGQRLAEQASSLRRAGLDALNVSLDACHGPTLAHLTGGGDLGAVERGLEAAREAGFAGIKLNTVLLRRGNGHLLEGMVSLARRHRCELRFIELMPLGPGAAIYEREHLPADEALSRVRRSMELVEELGQQGAARRYRLRDAGGREVVVGLISPVSRPFCHGCHRVRLDSSGLLYGCLRQPDGVDLRGPLLRGDHREVTHRIQAALDSKHAPGHGWPERSMAAIGG